MHTIKIELIDTSTNYDVINIWKAKGWRITHRFGDIYTASKTVAIQA